MRERGKCSDSFAALTCYLVDIAGSSLQSLRAVYTDTALSEQSVALVMKKRAAAVGYDPALFAGHSLRAGLLTEAGRTGATLFKMKEHSRHKSIEMLSAYVRDEEAFRNHAAEGFA